ncbi:MAG: hypothetical protein EBV34_21595, partial [Betaproteobacteria bacterium]|nr:hypothetical protein [Betaproteobacteria bacterium]
GANTTFTHTIVNDDSPTLQFSTASGSANEGNSGSSTITVQATLSAASTQTVTVPIAYSGSASSGIDYNNASTSITIAAGQSSGSVTFSIIGDTAVEPDEKVVLTLGAPTNATLGTNNTYTHTIRNDDAHTSSSYTPGQATIDLGNYGKLIYPVQVDGGKWYYFWDISGDGTAELRANDGSQLNGGNDYASLWAAYGPPLTWTFNKDINLSPNPAGNATDATYRYADLNGVKVALPLIGDSSSSGKVTDSAYFGIRTGTGVGSSTAGQGSSAPNAVYNDLLAIWDAYNGTSSVAGVSLSGTPPGWRAGLYHSATPFSIPAPTANTIYAEGHAALSLGTGEFNVSLPWSGPKNVAPGTVFGQWWTGYGFVALELVQKSNDTVVPT